MAIHNELGKKGEEVARQFLSLHGFRILETNKRFGKKEIDILSEKDNVIRIVEVKTTREGSFISPEDNFTKDKLQNLKYVLNLLESSEKFAAMRLQVDFLSVKVNLHTKEAVCRLVQNIDLN